MRARVHSEFGSSVPGTVLLVTLVAWATSTADFGGPMQGCMLTASAQATGGTSALASSLLDAHFGCLPADARPAFSGWAMPRTSPRGFVSR